MTIVKRHKPTYGQNLIVVNNLGEADRMKKIRDKRAKEDKIKKMKMKSNFNW